MSAPRVGVVGHVEWVDFAVCERLPAPGEIVEARECFSAAAGGGGVAAVQMSRLGGRPAPLLCALGRDAAGDAAAAALAGEVELHAARPEVPQRRALTHLTDDHERTITVMGRRLVAERDRDAQLPWDDIATWDAAYVTGGDVGALVAARTARWLVATPRVRGTLQEAGVALDVLVASASDPGERVETLALDPPPRVVVLTDGGRGGRWEAVDGTTGTWAPTPLPGPPVDAYGCGDTFAAAFTFGLGAGLILPDALALAARAGAECLTGRGPYGAPLTPA